MRAAMFYEEVGGQIRALGRGFLLLDGPRVSFGLFVA